MVSCFFAFAQLVDRALKFFFAQSGIFKDGRCGSVDCENGHEQRFESDIFVTLLLGDVKSLLQDIVGTAAQIRFASAHLRERCNLGVNLPGKSLYIGSNFGKDEVYQRLALAHDSFQQMDWLDGLVALGLGYLHGFLNRFLGFNRKVVEVHIEWI